MMLKITHFPVLSNVTFLCAKLSKLLEIFEICDIINDEAIWL